MLTRSLKATSLLAAGLALANPAFAKDRTAPAMSASEEAAVRLAVNRGQALYNYDQAAWHTTDALLADVKDPAKAGIRGWVVTPVAEGWRVTYWKPQGDGYAGVYSAVWTGRAVVQRKILREDETTLSPEQLALVAALKAIDVRKFQPCANSRFNNVVVPAEDGRSTLVYLMTPQSSSTAYPMGGHYRITVRDGAVVEERKFANSCLEVDTASPKANSRAAATVVSHLLDPTPTEIHVFTMFASKRPVYVVTSSNKLMWVIDAPNGKARITLQDRLKD